MKDYNEVAKRIFERRDKYIAKKKNIKKLIKNKITPVLCCCLVLIVGIFLVKNTFLKDSIRISENMQGSAGADLPQNDKTPYIDGSGGEITPNQNPPSVPDNSSGENLPHDKTPEGSASGGVETDPERIIDSIDKMNFYSAKKIIEENSFFPMNAAKRGFKANLSSSVIAYDKEFTVTKTTYFNIRINAEECFLAEKLGGTGIAEVVVIDTNIPGVYKMITFKLSDKYYTCLMSEVGGMNYSKNTSDEFTSSRYTSGFDILQSNEGEIYRFAVHYEGSQVVGFESESMDSTVAQNSGEEITFIDDYCVVIFTERTITINQLEAYVKNMKGEDML